MTNAKFKLLGEAKRRFPGVVFESRFADSIRVFVKTSSADVFRAEVAGLRALRQTDALRVAEVCGVGKSKRCGSYILVLEAIDSRAPTEGFVDKFARQLADLHRIGSGDAFGLDHDNFLGATDQPNAPMESWPDFWAQHRLGFQLKLAKENGLGGDQLQRLGAKLVGKLDSFIGGSLESPSLIHGDLWSGNWLCDLRGEPALIDPAIYYANRESEFGMTTLFGGLPSRFYDVYNEMWPMEDGWEERVAIYRLYHLLNHLNLFGASYLGDCLQILRRFV